MFKKGDRIRLIPEMCKQIEVRKLHGTIQNIHATDPPLEICWDNPDATNLSLFYECEVRKI